ncbi:MAG TPA: hypothetical protein VGQ55_09470, partial [Pyrinomonadaceae bacterium]|nr:hypothetical protein [Pyrinomonadaceae bacterium]
RPDENLAKFDEIAAKRKIVLSAGTDAHSNIGFHLFGDDAGNKLLNIKLDPYATTFGLVRLHVLIEKDKPFVRETLIEAIKAGRFFIGFDALGDTTGFRFGPDNQGDIQLVTPLSARIYLSCNGLGKFGGTLVRSSTNDNSWILREPQSGTWRVEVYRDDLGPPFNQMPWIISNPIYVR